MVSRKTHVFVQERSFAFKASLSLVIQKKRLSTRKQVLGVATHIEMQSNAYNGKYYMLYIYTQMIISSAYKRIDLKNPPRSLTIGVWRRIFASRLPIDCP